LANVAVVIVSFGNPAYHSAAYESVFSALDHTDAEIVFLTDIGEFNVPDDSRIRHYQVLQNDQSPRRFMTKLEAWRICLTETEADVLILLDADAVFITTAGSSELSGLVPEKKMAMVEQCFLSQFGWERFDYWRHYCETSLAAINSREKPPSPDSFRFFNSGFVVCGKTYLGDFLTWVDSVIHQVDFDLAARAGITITDQDFIQFWCNNLHPNQTSVLDWSWNHCSHWDRGFPRPGARVIHFSSFYHAPTPEVIASMRIARTRGTKRRY